MEIAYLGSLQVSQDGNSVLVRGGRERTLLVALASRAGKVVRTEELFDALWAEQLPADPMNSLHAAVSRLRRQLPSAGPSPLQISGTGYLLRVPSEQVDALTFEHRLAGAGGVEDPEAVARLLVDGVALGRGGGGAEGAV